MTLILLNYTNKGTKKAFSLVELLVTVSILLILISMISPSLNKMLRTAQETTCTQGIRDLLLVTHLYAEDYGGDFMDLRKNKDGVTVTNSSPYWANGYWRDHLTENYEIQRDQFYSPSNEKWNNDSFYKWGNGGSMVMGRFYFGSPSNATTFNNRTPTALRGNPTFANNLKDSPSRKVLWTDLNRRWNGYFVTPNDPSRRHGSNHLYSPDLDWPSLSHNGHYDGSVTARDSTEIKRQMQLNGIELFW